MQRGTGWVASLALLFALWRIPQDGPGAGASPPAPSPAVVDLPAPRAPSPGVGERLLRAHFGLPHGPRVPTGSQPAGMLLEVLIATLPDPNRSHLDWAYDSQLDAIRRGYESAGYLLDRFELPTGSADPSRVPGALLYRRSEKRHEQDPSRLLQPASLALLYVVHEVSTGGIERDAFAYALAERRELLHGAAAAALALVPSRGPELRVLGPTFSGSASSLRQALERESAALDLVMRIVIVSGAATSPGTHDQLAGPGAIGDAVVEFETTLHTDGVLMSVLTGQLLPALGLVEAEVAILKEANTAYGRAKVSADGMLELPFPLSISSLRQAYDRNGRTVRTDVAMPGRAASTNVPLDLDDQLEFVETLAAASALTPPSVDLLLEEMTRVLAQHGIRAVVLFATDVRDKLFLGSELKRRLPDLQLFTTEGNVLYLWPTLNRWLRGMLVLSTYPTMLSGAADSHSPTRARLLFSSEGAAGTYNATLVQLGIRGSLADYRTRSSQGTIGRPPVWVATVGAGTMLPVLAVPPEAGLAAPEWAPREHDEAFREPPDGKSPTLGIAAIFLLSGWLTWVFLRAGRGARGRPFYVRILARAKVLPPDGATGDKAHLVSLALQHELNTLCGLSALWSLLLPNATLLVLLAVSRFPRFTFVTTFAAAVAACASAAGLVVLCRRGRLYWKARRRHLGATIDFGPVRAKPTSAQAWKWRGERVIRVGLAVLGLVFLASTCLLSARIGYLILDGDPNNFTLFLRRTIEVDQGVSLLVPTSLIGIILALWCAWHRQRLFGLVRGEPAEVALDAWLAGADQPAARVRRRLFRVIPDGYLVALVLPVLPVMAWLFWRIERPLDDLVLGLGSISSPFDWILRGGLVSAIVSSSWAVLRLRSTWGALARLFRALEDRPALLPTARLRGRLRATVHLSLMPSALGPELERFARRAWEALLAAPEPLDPELVALRSRPGLAKAARARRDAAGYLDPRLVAALTELGASTSWKSARERELVEDVLGVEVLLYVDWILAQCRRLAWFLVAAVLLSTALVWSYPFQPQGIVQLVSLGVFLGVLVELMLLVAAMDRNATLSRLAGTTPGALTWNRSLITNLLIFGLVPLATLLTSHAPEIRHMLVDILRPFVSGLAAG